MHVCQHKVILAIWFNKQRISTLKTAATHTIGGVTRRVLMCVRWTGMYACKCDGQAIIKEHAKRHLETATPQPACAQVQLADPFPPPAPPTY